MRFVEMLIQPILFRIAGYEHLRFQSVFLVEMPPDSGFQHLVGHIMNLSGLLYPTTCKLFRPQPLEHRVFLRIECQVEQYDFRPVRKLDAVVRYPVVCESVGIGDLAERDQHGFAAILDVVSADEPARFRERPAATHKPVAPQPRFAAACCAAIDDVSDSRVGQVAVGKQLFVVDALLFFALL